MPVCITGMHRSGTSMVSHALSLCGLDLGPEDQLLPADAWNSDGYWENRKLVELDDWLLDQLGGGWDMPPAEQPSPELRESFIAAARQSVAEVGFGEQWGWKDPRVCLFADLWRDAITGLRFVVPVRNPVDVALSLRRRGSMSARLGLSLWAAYYSELLARVPASERIVVSYDAFLEDPAGSVERLVGSLGLDVDPAKLEAASASVNADLRHHASDLAGMPEDVVDLYTALLSEAKDGVPAEPPVAASTAKPVRVAAGGSAAEALIVAYTERDALRSHVEGLTADRDNWREQGTRLQVDRDTWRADAQHWRAETERLVSAEQGRFARRFRQARFRYARQAWGALPIGVRVRLRPMISRGVRHEFVGPEPFETGDSPSERPPARLPLQPRAVRTVAPRQPIDVPVSVVVPTFNAGTDAALFLDALKRQVGVPQLELVVVDSGSTDGTRERFAAAADVMLDIPSAEFGHGRTRNQAFAASSGDVVVMTVQDALLLGPHALHDLVDELLADDGLAAVSARQVPRSDADLYGAYNVVSHYKALWRDGRHERPSHPLYKRAAAGVDDVCAAIRRSVLADLQYRDVAFGEDLDFGMRAVDAGWRIGLSDAAAVAHSHTRDATYQFRRFVADRLNIASMLGDNEVCRSAAVGEVGEIAAAGRGLIGDVAATLALTANSHERLSLVVARVAERALEPLTTMEPSGGQLGALADFMSELAGGADGGAVSAPLREEFAGLLRWPLLVEFAEAQRAPSPDAAADFVAKLAATVLGHSVGDRLRVDDSAADRERLLVGV